MDVYVCDICGYRYDPEVGDPDNGIAPGTRFEDKMCIRDSFMAGPALRSDCEDY